MPEDLEIPPHPPRRDLPDAGADPSAALSLVVPATALTPASTVGELLATWGARSTVVLHRGAVRLDWRAPGVDPTRRQRSYSVTKSMTGTLAALAVHEGVLDRDALVGTLIPELAGTGVGDARVADVADMTASIAYDEDYAGMSGGTSRGGRRDFADYVVALGTEAAGTVVPPDAPRSVRAFLAVLQRGNEPHGRSLAYATPIADLLGWLLERSTGRSWRDLFVERLWSPCGAEHAARVTVDPEGVPTVGGGLAVTTRDLARLGLAIADPAVVPAAVREAIRDGGDPAVFGRGGFDHLDGYTYRDQWWMPGGPRRPMSAWGIYGQLLWIEPDADLVVAAHSGGGDPSSPARDLAHDAICRALAEASDGWV